MAGGSPVLVRHWRALIVLIVFVVALVISIGQYRASHTSFVSSALPQFPINDPVSACRAWSGIDPVINKAVSDSDPRALYHLESGGAGSEYQQLMAWAQAASQRGQAEQLATDLINLEGEVGSAANGSYPIRDLTIPAGAVNTQCASAPAAPT